MNDRLLLAVSGGVDSVVLCSLCKESGYEFAIAHCNYQLRGEESFGDERFVEELAGKYKVPFFIKRFETTTVATENKTGIQETARELRYKWFHTLFRPDDQSSESNAPTKFSCIVTAHHADDNIETIMMNFFKGTGTAGLKGMLPISNGIARPLLFAFKEQLQSYAHDKTLDYRVDASNESNHYTRNYFRNKLIPALEKVFPNVKDNLHDNIRRFRDIHSLYEQSVESVKKKLLIKKGNEWHIPVLALSKNKTVKTVVYEIIRDFGFSARQVDEVLALLKSESGKFISSGTHRILRNRRWLIVSAHSNSENDQYLIEESDKKILFHNNKLEIEKSAGPAIISTDAHIALLDLSGVRFPLLLRKWKQGDYFYPLGMRKKKKLSRFFIDQKISLFEKEKIWVLESDMKILWVIGYRIDDRVKITPSTKAFLKLKISPSK